MSYQEINTLINKWVEIYKMTDKRTRGAKNIKAIVYKLSSLIGLI